MIILDIGDWLCYPYRRIDYLIPYTSGFKRTREDKKYKQRISQLSDNG